MMARNLDRLTAYYRGLLGLTVQEHTRHAVKLGVGGVTLIELIHRPDALSDDQREAGLYHTAFLMPTRGDLARWILYVAKNRVPIIGASDHDVSEAIYLDDPEGNGVEVYSDRPREKWLRDGEMIFQRTDPLDIDAITSEINPVTATYPAAPKGLRIGHIHLRVGGHR
jgi:catechol 2,3-dioxygenase